MRIHSKLYLLSLLNFAVAIASYYVTNLDNDGTKDGDDAILGFVLWAIIFVFIIPVLLIRDKTKEVLFSEKYGIASVIILALNLGIPVLSYFFFINFLK